MNIKIKNEDDLVFKDYDNKLDTVYSPEIKEYKGRVSQSDYILAWLFSLSKSFNKAILEIRNKLGLKQTIKYHKNSTVDSLITLILNSFDSEKYRLFESLVEELRKKYQLTENWYFSLRVAILTNTLLIPPETQPIMIHIPESLPKSEEKKEKDNPKSLSNIASIANSPEVRLMDEIIRITSYPGIYFTSQVTIDELKKWINRNKQLLRAIQSRLPKRKMIKREKKTLFWGQMVWILRQDGVISWAEITERLQKIIDEFLEEHPEESDVNDFTQTIPNPSELQKYYGYFLDTLQDLEAT